MVIGSACKKSTIFGVNSDGEFVLKISKCKVKKSEVEMTSNLNAWYVLFYYFLCTII